MAGASLLALLDDIASILDDVAALTKVAAHKTAGVLSDDLALNAEQVSGFKANRELPVVWAVGKGSLINKFILIPGALIIDYFAPWLIVLLLMLGGAYLCYEGAEKILHSYTHRKNKKSVKVTQAKEDEIVANIDTINAELHEKKKIRGAIRTDFILSAEIIVIALNTVQEHSFLIKTLVLIATGILITVGVYGIVAAIVKLDDIGYWLIKKYSHRVTSFYYKLGQLLVNAAPYLMKFLSIVGTIAMFLVGGGIIAHNIAAIHHLEDDISDWFGSIPAVGDLLNSLTTIALNTLLGLIIGSIILFVVSLSQRIKKSS